MQKSDTPLLALERAIAAAGTAAELARKVGVLNQHIAHWKNRGVPADRCAGIESVTGVRCEELRPDLNWQRDVAGNVTGYFVPASLPDKAA